MSRRLGSYYVVTKVRPLINNEANTEHVSIVLNLLLGAIHKAEAQNVGIGRLQLDQLLESLPTYNLCNSFGSWLVITI